MDAERIAQAARLLGYRVDASTQAGTGTEYIHLSRDGYYVTVRIADHAEAYAPARGERLLSVSPYELSAEDAIAMLATPEQIEPYTPAPKTPEERAWHREDAARETARQDSHRAAWQSVREALTDADWQEWRTGGMNRQNAKRIAARLGKSAAVVYAAFTGGRRY